MKKQMLSNRNFYDSAFVAVAAVIFVSFQQRFPTPPPSSINNAVPCLEFETVFSVYASLRRGGEERL